jgi:serine protease
MNHHHRPPVALRPNQRSTPAAEAGRRPAARAVVALAAGLVIAAGWVASARAEAVSSIRLRLHPYAADGGQLPDGVKARLEALAGSPLTLTGTTRTGAVELALPAPRSRAEADAMLRALRQDRGVLWAEVPASRAPVDKVVGKAAGPKGDRLLVRLNDGAADWATLSARFAAALGVGVTVERQIGGVWLLRLDRAQDATTLAAFASRLQDDGAVRFADPVLRRFRQAAVPNDALYGRQWGLFDPVAGINAPAAWDLTTGAAGMVVAVVDTGIQPHPDMTGRTLPGYDFISSAEDARDGNGRDGNPRDEGDWIDEGGCGGYPATPSSWHGTFIAGQIAANTNNGQGIAGVDWRAKVLPVRVLGQCGGTDADVFEGMLWASGVAIAGVPANPNPARVINLSLGGPGACTQAIQEAVDDALAQGAVVVAAAGNESDNAANYAPANCSGVITVAALNVAGERAFYSNFGTRVDLAAPAGETVDDATVSHSNRGETSPGDPAYSLGIGTSFSAPLVSGVASLMLGRNPTMTPGRVLGILQGTARDFPAGTTCGTGNLCGTGMLDAGAAVASTIPATGDLPPGSIPVVEYYNADLDHYFITASTAEMDALDADPAGTFQRTGLVFYGYFDPLYAPASMPVCRFYAGADVHINSHFFSAAPNECLFVQNNWPGVWNLEDGAAFWIEVPDAAGACPAGRVPVYRFFNNRRDANHRYTIDLSVKRAMINRGWVPEGAGPNSVAFCSAI